MTVGEGKFLLYSYLTPALKAGDYRFDVSQHLSAKKGSAAVTEAELPVDALASHVRVTAPRYQLPPDQVLSTFPPAGTEGAYGSRLPQVVIKRRTLPWERRLTLPAAGGVGPPAPVDERTPWLALVLVAEGEAKLRLNTDVGQCVTPGVVLEGEQDVAKGNCLVIGQSMLEKVLPSRKDVPLLAHAREVDIGDTELMMGDDDGFLSVVIGNRLPMPGTDADGQPVPVTYLACLINLEGQFHRLIPEAPAPRAVTDFVHPGKELFVEASVFDHVTGGGLAEHWADPAVNPELAADFGQLGFLRQSQQAPGQAAPALGAATKITALGPGTSAYTSHKGHTAAGQRHHSELVSNFDRVVVTAEPQYTFPVLLHWSFVSTGNVTFETLMTGLDSGLLGTVPQTPSGAGAEPAGRSPLEVVQTGHVGLTHRTRRGDTVRTWYRGPLLAHPSSGERLPIAHSSDQLRAVIPDGREDLSLAAAFEVGRLLALSRPAMVAALLRWRQRQFEVARSRSIWDAVTDLPFEVTLGAGLRRQLESRLRELVTTDPDTMIGPHRNPIGPGDPVDWGAAPLELIGRGYGIQTPRPEEVRDLGDLVDLVGTLREIEPPVARFDARADRTLIADALHTVLDTSAEQLMSNVLANEIAVDPVLGSAVIRTPEIGSILEAVRGGIVGIEGGIVRGWSGPGRGGPGPGGPAPGPFRDQPDPLDALLDRPPAEEET
nr:hypothetical protein [uncultured Friedmanniella sp.]